MPVRAGARDADVDHGRHGTRRRDGRALKNAEALELLEQIDTLVVDKTGTLTEGRPTLTTVSPQAGFDETQLLRLVGSLEQVSEHPLAAAIVGGARERGVKLLEAG